VQTVDDAALQVRNSILEITQRLAQEAERSSQAAQLLGKAMLKGPRQLVKCAFEIPAWLWRPPGRVADIKDADPQTEPARSH